MQQELARPKLLVIGLGISVVIFSVVVLGYVGTSPDIGLRGLLSDSDRETPQPGMMIRQILDDVEFRGHRPEVRDLLVRIHDRPIRSFIDFCRSLQYLRSAPIGPGGKLEPGTDPSEFPPNQLPSLVEIGPDRWVEIEFQHAGRSERSWLVVGSVPLGEILLSFTWLLLQFGIFAISALAAWHRPYDRSARLFFGMCAVVMAGFMGGFHWWVVSASPLLNSLFLVSAVLVPSVSLHFFLCYPRPLGPMERHPRRTVWVMYTVPTLAALFMLTLLSVAWWLSAPEMSDRSIVAVQWCLRMVREAIYVYLAFAAICFFVMLIALSCEYLSSSSPVERSQIKWMLRAGLISLLPISYTLYLALFDRTAFALGSARLPMFLASLSFTLAYTVGIARFKLMLVDQLVTRGMMYYAVSQGLTLGYGVCVALVAFFANDLNMVGTLPGWFQQALSLGVLLTFLVVVLTWSRDRVQQSIDRRFYREKYQLDRALQRVNRSLDQLEDRHALGQRMLVSCRDVLGTRFGAIYLRESTDVFQVVATDGTGSVPEQLSAPEGLDERLRSDQALQWSTVVSGDPLRKLLRSLNAELVFPLEADGEIEGLVVLARRTSGAPYSAEDLTFLSTLGQFTCVALRSVKVHQDFARLNEELRLKATRIDEQRRQIAMMQAELTSGSPAREPSPESELRRDMIRGDSTAIRQVLETVRKVAPTESTVLIQGASGTGKELLAQAIHENSQRHAGPMVRVHCAALSPSLLESELFGHVKGAFTGAHRDRVGRFEMAHGGTLFLDEIGDISLETQIKLLRVLQTRSFEPVGGTRTIEVDVRLITATHQNLQKLIAEGRFREDLFYRLNVVNITLPTLQQRREDIFELSLHFLKQAAQRSGRRVLHINEEAQEALKRYQWPGNIRELENVIERAVVLSDGDHISLAVLPPELVAAGEQAAAVSSARPVNSAPVLHAPPATVVSAVRASTGGWRPTEEADEYALLESTLRECGGNKAQAARRLNMPRSTFFSKLKKAGLT